MISEASQKKTSLFLKLAHQRETEKSFPPVILTFNLDKGEGF